MKLFDGFPRNLFLEGGGMPFVGLIKRRGRGYDSHTEETVRHVKVIGIKYIPQGNTKPTI
jgi:hypothetical protein